MYKNVVYTHVNGNIMGTPELISFLTDTRYMCI